MKLEELPRSFEDWDVNAGSEYDIILLDQQAGLSINLHGSNTSEDKFAFLDELGKKLPNQFFFYFGKPLNPSQLASTEISDRVSFANAKTQLIGNLLNAIRYIKLI